jgi:Tol biopolymer transport system component/DNA-binding winged helix-turn-helix (wHTH) protein
MAETHAPAPVWRFGAFELQGHTAELRKNGVVIHLQEQPARLLVYLLQHAGQIVTRDDVRIHLWPADTFVDFDHALNTAVMKLREALGDSSEKPLYIQTIPRKGYRFVAPVSLLPSNNSVATVGRTPASAQVDVSPAPGDIGNGTDASYAQPQVATKPAPHSDAEESQPIPPTPAEVTTQTPPRRAIRFVLVAAALILLTFVGAFLYKRTKPAVAPARSLTRITFDEGLQSEPTWSPDGRYIAYTAVRDGVAHIWMQQISTGVPIQITSGPGPDTQPDWSPDGKYIAYRSGAGEGGLFIIPALGGAGQERRIAAVGYNPRWSPDSSQILFRGGWLPWRGVSELYVVGLDGGQPQQVLAAFFKQHASILPISAAWHPDGKRVTVWAENPFRPEPSPIFWTVPLHDGPAVSSEIAPEVEARFRELAVQRGQEWVVDSTFAWAPSGKALYFERTFRGARSLWRLNIDPTTLRATSVDHLTSSGGLDTGPAVSPDGKRLAFTVGSGRVSAWVYPFDANRGRITGAGRPVTSPGINAWMTSMSPDGSKLAFVGVRAGETGLWLKPLPQGRELPLVGDHYKEEDMPQWSPDGTRLAYIRRNRDAVQFMMWSAETRREEALTTRHSVGEQWELLYDWTADGKSLLISKPPPLQSTRDEVPTPYPNLAVWRLALSAAPHAEAQERMIIADPAYELYQAHQSPDGQWIAFEAVPRSNPQNVTLAGPSSLFVMRSSGGPWLPIITKGWADKPRWSPDGRTIYFLWTQGSFLNVWGIRFDPKTGKTLGDPFRVTKLDDPALTIPAYISNVEISVTRKNLALTLGQISGGIWVLDNVDR